MKYDGAERSTVHAWYQGNTQGAIMSENSEPRQIVDDHEDDEFLIEEIDVVPVDSLLTMRC